jgi:hypothetical protein
VSSPEDSSRDIRVVSLAGLAAKERVSQAMSFGERHRGKLDPVDHVANSVDAVHRRLQTYAQEEKKLIAEFRFLACNQGSTLKDPGKIAVNRQTYSLPPHVMSNFLPHKPHNPQLQIQNARAHRPNAHSLPGNPHRQ